MYTVGFLYTICMCSGRIYTRTTYDSAHPNRMRVEDVVVRHRVVQEGHARGQGHGGGARLRGPLVDRLSYV